MLDFRVRFSKFEDSMLLNVAEVAQLLLTTPQAVYKRMKRDPSSVPRPCVHGPKQLRFRAGDVREWLTSLQPNQTTIKAIGRPRARVVSSDASKA